MSRPTIKTEAVIDELCERIAGDESLRTICMDAHLPDRTTVLRWLATDDAFAAKYTRARATQGEAIVDDMGDVENDVLAGRLDPRAASVVLSSKQWRASKLAPKKYGIRSAVELSGPDGGHVGVAASVDLSDEQLGAIAAAGRRRG